jgi:hypothetical protein
MTFLKPDIRGISALYVSLSGAIPAIRYIFYVRRGGHKKMPLLRGGQLFSKLYLMSHQ